MHDCPEVAPVSRCHEFAQLIKREARTQVVINYFQIIGSFRNPCVNKSLSVILRPEHRIRRTFHFAGMSARRTGADAGGTEIGGIGVLALLYLLTQSSKLLWIAPHVQFRRNAERRCLFQSLFLLADMAMRVNEAR